MSGGFTIVSVQVGHPRTLGRADATDEMDRPWRSAIVKEPVAGPVRVRRSGVAGDEQASPGIHGGLDQAVLAYCGDHYAKWRAEIGIDMPGGGFGENLTVLRLDEHGVCLGDRWEAGEVLFEVTQPRGPCNSLVRRWRRADLVERTVANARCGWYLRVLREGTLAAGTSMRLAARPRPRWTVARAHAVKHAKPIDSAAAAELLALPELGRGFRASLERRLGAAR